MTVIVGLRRMFEYGGGGCFSAREIMSAKPEQSSWNLNPVGEAPVSRSSWRELNLASSTCWRIRLYS
jgi:hypothetical protein